MAEDPGKIPFRRRQLLALHQLTRPAMMTQGRVTAKCTPVSWHAADRRPARVLLRRVRAANRHRAVAESRMAVRVGATHAGLSPGCLIRTARRP